MSRNNKPTLSLLWILAKTDFKLRYSGSVLGFVWAFLKPLLIFIILNFVFSSLFAGNIPHFSIKLLLGIILFTFFSEGTMAGMLSLVSKAHILKKIKVRQWIIVVSSTLHIFFSFIINITIVLLFMLGQGIVPSVAGILWFCFYIVMMYLIVIGFSFVTSVLYVTMRDLNQIWEVLLNILFYASPIIYPLSIIPQQYHLYLFFNPLTFIIEHSKQVLVDDMFSAPDKHIIFAGVVIVCFFLSHFIFTHISRRTNEKL